MKAFGLLLLVITTVASASQAKASLIISYTGTLEFASGSTDILGLDGASFEWTGEFDPAATRSFTNGSNLDRFTGQISLTITGSNGNDGTYTPADHNAISEIGGATFDFYAFGSFEINNIYVYFSGLTVSSGFTGASSASNTLTPVNTSDVRNINALRWYATDSDSSQYDYDVNSASVTSSFTVPEPGTIWIVSTIPLVHLSLRKRRGRRS